MDHLTVGVFHDEALARELGKKGTESDLLMFNRKTEDRIFTFIAPASEKVSVKCQVASAIDCAVVSCVELTADVGETILLLDALGVSKGLLLVPPFSDHDRVVRLVKGTCLESFQIVERDVQLVSEWMSRVVPFRDSVVPAVVTVDHSFSVKGVGEVILGFVRQGTVRRHDVLRLLPVSKDVSVRSIQMQDKDFEEAGAGCRVGLLIKDATVDEMRRGSMLCAAGAASSTSSLTLRFVRNKFYPEVKTGLFHVAVGMQTVPASVTAVNNGDLSLSLEKPVGFVATDTFLLLDLNAKKMHLMGKGTVVSG
jgi:selenocysteine-specific translation elongation factor